MVVSCCGIAAWPELAAALVQCLQSTEVALLDGGLNTLFKVREHCVWGEAGQQNPIQATLLLTMMLIMLHFFCVSINMLLMLLI